METNITNQFTTYERQLIALFYSCPFSEPLKSCIISPFRMTIKSDYHNSINSFEKNKISGILAEHQKCFLKRAMYKGTKPIIQKLITEKKNIAYLKWTKNGNLDFLTLELKKRNWIRSRKNFTYLFDEKDNNLKVYWNSKYKYELAYLLFILKERNFIRTVNSKGYFRIAERQIIDYSDKTFKINSLKQISSKISIEPDKHVDITKSVEIIIDKITLKTNRLIKDYS